MWDVHTAHLQEGILLRNARFHLACAAMPRGKSMNTVYAVVRGMGYTGVLGDQPVSWAKYSHAVRSVLHAWWWRKHGVRTKDDAVKLGGALVHVGQQDGAGLQEGEELR
jgi:hypothetical protein